MLIRVWTQFDSLFLNDRWSKQKANGETVVSVPPGRRGELQHCALTCHLTWTETVCTVEHGSPQEIHPITSCTHLSRHTHSASCLSTTAPPFLSPSSFSSSSLNTASFGCTTSTTGSLDFRAIGEGHREVWHHISLSEPWTERLQAPEPTAKFKLFSSSRGIPCQGATANSVSFLWGVSANILQLQEEASERSHTAALCLTLTAACALPLSLIYQPMNFFSFSCEKKRSTAEQNTPKLVCVCESETFADDLWSAAERCLYLLIWDILASLRGDEIWSFHMSTWKMGIL